MDLATITAGLAAAKAGFDILRNAVGLVKDAESILPDGEKKEVIGRTLEEADKQLRLAEAQIAQGLRYPLCRCAFPPTPMLTVGYWITKTATEYAIAAQLGKTMGVGAVTIEVDECPLCKKNNAGDHDFIRYDQSNTSLT